MIKYNYSFLLKVTLAHQEGMSLLHTVAIVAVMTVCSDRSDGADSNSAMCQHSLAVCVL